VPEIALVTDQPAADLAAYLRDCGFAVTDRVSAADVLLILSAHPDEALLPRLAAGQPALLAGPSVHAWRDAVDLDETVGLAPGPLTACHELRLRPGPAAGSFTDRMPHPLVLAADRVLTTDKILDHTEVLLSASVGLAQHPVATRRGSVAALTVGWTPETLADPGYHRLVHRLLRLLLGETDGPAVGVGLLGYGAIGHQHSAAIGAVAGLELAAVCDPDPARIAAARELVPDVAAYSGAAQLLADQAVGAVIVSTPPNTHAQWAVTALAAGKSVVVEKPFCLTVAEADTQIDAAAARGLTLAVYQNRRWDADYLALRRACRAGRLGDVFHYESFIGGYGHPCNYWHSDAGVSGGAIYDWGSHYLDWALDLMPQQVEWVSATAHKRVWHDVTNADHTRVLVHFADGAEAEFTHSDLAAAAKPKWYVLGTRGAVVGSWRDERVRADFPATLDLFAADGSVTRLAQPLPPAHAFHSELADHLLTGAPMSVTPQGSRRNIAVMQAATASTELGGRPVAL